MRTQRCFTRALCILSISLAAAVSTGGSAIGQTAPAPVLGYTKLGTGIPTGASPDANGKKYSIDVYFFNPDGSLGKKAVEVSGIPAVQGLPNPTPAQIQAARAAKAQAIVTAINAEMLNGVTATRDPNDPTQFRVDGVRQSVGKYALPVPGTPGTYLGAPVTRTPGNRVTGEVGDENFNFKQGVPPGGSGSPTKGSFKGTSPSGTVTVGLDASGFGSTAGFGYIDYATSIPVNYTVSMSLSAGLSESQVLTALANLFNQTYSLSGRTASYDPVENWLILDQLLPATAALWSSDSDVALDLSATLVAVPEPTSAGLLSGGVIAILVRRPRRDT